MKNINYILVVGVLGSSNLYAATPFTDTGSIYRQIKQNQMEKAERSKQKQELETRKELIKSHTHSEKTFYVKKIVVLNNIDLSLKKQNEVLSPYENRTLSLTDIRKAAKALEQAHLDHGDLTVDVAISMDKINKGIVEFTLSGGVLEENGVSVENSGKRIKTEKVEGLLNNILKPGVITRDAYERAILLSNDFPGISAKGDMYLGEEELTNDLVVTITDEDVFNGNIDIDNFGSYYTGRTQLGATLYWNSPTKNGEEIVARFITTGKYSNYGYIDFAIPVFDNGTRIGISIDYLDYELDNQAVFESGDGTVWDTRLYAKYPLIRSQDLTVVSEIAYVHTSFKDNSHLGEIDDSKIDKGVLTISGNHSDDFLENGITYFDVSLTTGHLKLDNKVNKANDALTSKTAGNFTKLNFEIARLQNIAGDFSSKVSFAGQWASKNLDTSEKYFLGGPYGISGYPVGTVGGDNAAVFYADLRYDFYDMSWGGDFQLSTFYTYAWTEIFKNSDAWKALYPGDQYGSDNQVRLQTVGIAMSQTWSDTTVIRIIGGKQVGKNVLRKYYDGDDYDESDSDYRLWAEAIYYF